ncbi:phosphonate ABC transporter, permease protein PhnE [Teichococcus vastitatis]|uniref:Phosphonate ABC transporter, permease protein PhnE n=1 Tax=Teichococcus vastitatis TaxID=2307076 RepID=A0ABS9W771_9PROT|nr:phosphonate ABC transporter, permease protein PhnE [Pseudoroseomonas vastitatis]MCI0755131.1 phosphonate ABC transporter, permease protein PhnE [Pseudoroseomonas vastitatis]
MASTTEPVIAGMPRRIERPSALGFIGYAVALAVLVWAFGGSGWSMTELVRGIPSLGDFLLRAWPPRIERLDSLFRALVETFQMALVGTLVGAVLSLPLAIAAARGLIGSRVLAAAARGLVAFFRTVPDLIWALLFVIAVGLGPFAGTLAIVVDTIGFCARFFAEALEDVDRGPMEALSAQGVRRSDSIFCTLMPAAMPAFITTAMFAVEKSTRSSVILGLVGAGGIGLELKVAMDLFDYPTAATILLMIFALVVAVEQAGAWARRRVLGG